MENDKLKVEEPGRIKIKDFGGRGLARPPMGTRRTSEFIRKILINRAYAQLVGIADE